MMQVSQEKTIGGLTFEIRMLDLDSAEETLVLLANMGGAALHGIGQDMQAMRSGRTWEMAAAAAASGIGGILTKLTAAQVKKLRTTFASACSVRLTPGGPFVSVEDAQHSVFVGKLDVMLQWLAACIEVNYSSFFGELRARITEAIALASKEDPEASES